MSNAELIAEARRAFNEWYGSAKSEAEAGSRSHEWVRQYGNELLTALESQPEQTAFKQPAENLNAASVDSSLTPNVDDREALGEILALVDNYDACHQRVREWHAMEEWEQVTEEYPHMDAEDAEFWNRRADAAIAWFSRAQGDVTVEWGVMGVEGGIKIRFSSEEAARMQARYDRLTLVSRTVTPWKEHTC